MTRKKCWVKRKKMLTQLLAYGHDRGMETPRPSLFLRILGWGAAAYMIGAVIYAAATGVFA